MKIIALFNLKPGVSPADYQAWAHARDIPTVRALPSIADFEVLETTGLLGGGAPPYQYVEIIEVKDEQSFASDIGTPAMKAIAAEFAAMTDTIFLTTRAL